MVLGLWLATCAHAETGWLTVMGDSSDSLVNTIEVDPTSVSQSKEGRVMRIRVSRSAPRVSWDGVPYRSYVSQVLFDCTFNRARYLSIEFYKESAWKGVSHQTTHYSPETIRLMEFRDVTPNPTRRIVRAACQSASVTSN